MGANGLWPSYASARSAGRAWAKGSLAAAILAGLWLAAATAQEIRIEGSSTLHPLMIAAAEEFTRVHPDASLSVRFSGTGAGFDLLCEGLAEIVGASRPITQAEIMACGDRGIEFIEVPVAYDLVTVVVSSSNDWADCMSIEELRILWRDDSTVSRWSDIRAEWPNEEITLHAPGVASGTYDVFAESLLGSGAALRADFFPSSDGALLAEAVANDPNAISFFGYAYYLGAADSLRAVAIDSGSGCDEPALGAAVLLRPPPFLRVLFVYANAAAVEEMAGVGSFVELLLSSRGRELVGEVGYLPLEAEAHRAAQERFAARVTGTGAAAMAPLSTPRWP